MNTVKLKIINKETTVGTMLSEIYTPNIVRILAAAKYEFIFVDCEHGYFDFNELACIAAICRGFGISIIVRVPSVQREFITRVLDIGVDGLLLPQIDTPQLAQKAILLSKYTPEGKRGVSTTRAHTDYHVNSVADYIKTANQNLILLAQIESKEAVGNAYDIASIKGIDGIIVGPNDMAADYGCPGETFSEQMKENISKVLYACDKAGKPCGIVDSNIERLKFWKNKGMSIFCIGSEIHLLLSAATSSLQRFSQVRV